MTGLPGAGPLVSAAELARSLAASPGRTTLLDVRYETGAVAGASGLEAFLAAHLPGARYVDLDADLAERAGPGGRHPLPDPARFQAAMRRAGVDDARPVVVYDDWQGRAAARAWWLLRLHGHRDVRVLDGGLAAWREAGGALEAGPDEGPSGDFTRSPAADGMPMVGAEDVLAVDVLVDARAPERFRGEVEPVDPVAGHIPGAVNVPTSSNLDASGRFAAAEALAGTYAAVGVRDDRVVAAYCGSGVTAAHDVLAMEVAGIRAALYPGSWSGWIADERRPVQRSA